MGYRNFINSHFDGCRLLANAYDEHRNRAVRIFMMPGQFDVVGVSDGTDSWVAPVIADPFSVSVKRILDDIQAGKDPVVETKGRRRVQLLQQAQEITQSSTSRKRVALRSEA
jgi:hypothetical protein